MTDPFTIEAGPTSAAERARRWLRDRRLMVSGVVALVEVIAFLIWRPSALLLAMLAIALLVVCVMGATRIGPGLLRDVLWVVAIAQGIVVMIPLVVGVSLVAALVTAIAILVAFIAIAARWRV